MSSPIDPPDRPVHDAATPDPNLVVNAALRLDGVMRDPDRDAEDKRHAIDALIRALERLRESL